MNQLHDIRWDHFCRGAVIAHLPDVDWRWLKAQAYQESRFDPDALSPAGAVGVMQFMEPTWEEMITLGVVAPSTNRTDAKASIYAGAAYMALLRRKWWFERPDADRYALALASYNAGMGSLLRAQEESGHESLYPKIIRHLPAVTGEYAKETTTYVRRIYRNYNLLVLGGG